MKKGSGIPQRDKKKSKRTLKRDRSEIGLKFNKV